MRELSVPTVVQVDRELPARRVEAVSNRYVSYANHLSVDDDAAKRDVGSKNNANCALALQIRAASPHGDGWTDHLST
jgi:hypothetical protein